MSLYSDAVCPTSHAVRFVLAEKAINVEIHNIVGEEERPQDLVELNPYNSVLTLVDRDLVLYEAQVIMEYLDERFPHPPLMPVDPVARANNRQYRYRFWRDTYSILPDFTLASREHAAIARRKLRDQLVSLSAIFAQTPYFMADDYSLVDCYLAPILWRIPYYNIKLPNQAKPLLQYADRLFRREAFKRSLTEPEREMREI